MSNFCYGINKKTLGTMTDKEIYSIEIALNLIEKQQAEIEQCKSNVKAKNERLLEYAEELEKKDKIINLMAKDIKEADKFLDSMGYLGEYEGYTIEGIIEEYNQEIEKGE